MKYLVAISFALLCGCGSNNTSQSVADDPKSDFAKPALTIAGYTKILTGKTHCKDFEKSISSIPDTAELLTNAIASNTLEKNEFETSKFFESRSRKAYGTALGNGVPFVFKVLVIGNDLYYDADQSQLIMNLFTRNYDPSTPGKSMLVNIYDHTKSGSSYEASNAMGAKIDVDTETGDQGHLIFPERQIGKHLIDNLDRIYIKVDSRVAQYIKTANHMIIIGRPSFPYHMAELRHHKATFSEPHESNVTDHEYPITLQCVIFAHDDDVVYDMVRPGE